MENFLLVAKPRKHYSIWWYGLVMMFATLTVSAVVARLEGWTLGAALHVVSDALMNNGSGKHHVQRPATRLVLVLVCLVGFFVLIEFLQQLLPSAIGWEKQWQMQQRSEIITLAPTLQ